MPSKWKALARRAEGHEPKSKKSVKRRGRSRSHIVAPLIMITLLSAIGAVVAYSLIIKAQSGTEVLPTVTAEITATPVSGELEESTATENALDVLSSTILNLVPFFLAFGLGIPILVRVFHGGRD